MKSKRVSKLESASQDLFSKQKLVAISEYFAADYTVHLTDGILKGHAPVAQFFATLYRAFPKLTIEVDVLLERDDRVAWQRTLGGVQQNALQGFPGTGREVVWRDMVVSRFDGLMITEEWVVSDIVERVLRSRKKT